MGALGRFAILAAAILWGAPQSRATFVMASSPSVCPDHRKFYLIMLERAESCLLRLPDGAADKRGIGVANKACIARQISYPATQKSTHGYVCQPARKIPKGNVHRRHAIGEGAALSKDVQRLLKPPP